MLLWYGTVWFARLRGSRLRRSVILLCGRNGDTDDDRHNDSKPLANRQSSDKNRRPSPQKSQKPPACEFQNLVLGAENANRKAAGLRDVHYIAPSERAMCAEH